MSGAGVKLVDMTAPDDSGDPGAPDPAASDPATSDAGHPGDFAAPGSGRPGDPAGSGSGSGLPGGPAAAGGADGSRAPERPAPPAAPASGPGGLSVRDRALLALERRSWAGPGAKERAIREELGIAPVRYYQLLNALIDDERALREDPVTVHRLRRVRDARRGRR